MNLKPKTVCAMVFFGVGKLFGLAALATMFMPDKRITYTVGTLWGISIVLSAAFAISSWRDGMEDREREEYEKLKAKYG